MIAVRLLLLLLAVIAFVLKAVGVQSRVDLTALGLLFWVLTLVIQ